ncbi:hypothetical protein [Naasia aerilata]|uniref:Uncharacterized protein n=1 Tax=Naasia aerilata TaxID=1162966 RepID=A0ABN6XQN5_9MICO|nr:hypothetical protein [Naasia aerilata]BDZ47166.1 hypothetical protein GCM10025866_30750 [Naasia aerilata]
MELTRSGLTAAGFQGFVQVADLATVELPAEPGIYVVIREGGGTPAFRGENVGGWFKGTDPSVALESLEDAWVDDQELLYVGGTGDGDSASTLRDRMGLLRRFAAGEPVGHWGGRYLWQLHDRHRLLVAWKVVPPTGVKPAKAALLSEFWDRHGALPFANLSWR